MKRRHFISFVFVLILCIGMIGCGKEKKTTASDKFQSDYMEIGVGTTVEKGYFGVINGLFRKQRGSESCIWKRCIFS